MPKCVELLTPSNAIKYKFKKVELGNIILKYEVIHDALEVICNKNVKHPLNFGEIGTDRN